MRQELIELADTYRKAGDAIHDAIHDEKLNKLVDACAEPKTREEMMEFLMDGVDRPESITVYISSKSNQGGCTK